MLDRSAYLRNPCRESSLPYWKTRKFSVPDNMLILHQDEFNPKLCELYTDEPYFRLLHTLQDIPVCDLPQGYALHEATLSEYAQHINHCYHAPATSESALRSSTAGTVYAPSLWLAVRDSQSNEIAATGIAEIDPDCHEGILEWIQVSDGHRRHGLGSYLVAELLRRMKDSVHFATVSGQCRNPFNPEGLYRKCGFTGSDVWHVLRRREY